ncbi:MAG: glutathione ABC transporter substrate-binding protein [Synergistaceae bacterium]|jgi:peptide/nickel transport system substrate-binding protein|nr:glutathione ABC transporter substrate-binding protein [Synergistaceae bacterium]
MSNLRKVLYVLLTAAILISASLPLFAAQSDTPKDTITVASGADPKSLDPYGTTDSPAGRVASQIFETLVERDDAGNIVPALAESWEVKDPTTYVFRIRRGVKFHNGEELTAKDVKFSFDKMSSSPHASSVTGTIDFVNSKVIDDHTFEMKMSEPFGPILNHLCHGVMAIVNEKGYTESGSAVNEKPIGTGPYKFVSWKTADSVTLTKFDGYWGEKAKVTNLVFRTIPEAASRVIEVETGGVDVALQVPPSAVSRLGQNKDVKIETQETFTTNFLAFTCSKAPMDNVKLRQAINMAIDINAIQKVVFRGIGMAAVAPIGPSIKGSSRDLPPHEYDPEKAKKLLSEAGYPNGLKLTLTSDENQERLDVAEMVQAQLAEIGVDLEVITLERGKFIDDVIAGNLQMFALGWTTNTGDPDYALYASFHTSMFGEGGNMSFYSNPKVDELLTKGRISTDEETRMEAYNEAQKIIWEEVPCVFYLHPQEITAYSASLKNFNSAPDGRSDFERMYF